MSKDWRRGYIIFVFIMGGFCELSIYAFSRDRSLEAGYQKFCLIATWFPLSPKTNSSLQGSSKASLALPEKNPFLTPSLLSGPKLFLFK